MTTWMVSLNVHDQRMLHALLLRRRAWLDRLMRRVTHMGDAAVTIGAALLLLMLAPTGPGARAAFALAASHLAVQLLKRSVARARPRLPVGAEFLVRMPECFSFPSGHAASALSVYWPLASALPAPIAAPLFAIALLVGFSRAYLGVHFPSDVLVGWLLAAGALLVAPRVVHAFTF